MDYNDIEESIFTERFFLLVNYEKMIKENANKRNQLKVKYNSYGLLLNKFKELWYSERKSLIYEERLFYKKKYRKLLYHFHQILKNSLNTEDSIIEKLIIMKKGKEITVNQMIELYRLYLVSTNYPLLLENQYYCKTCAKFHKFIYTFTNDFNSGQYCPYCENFNTEKLLNATVKMDLNELSEKGAFLTIPIKSHFFEIRYKGFVFLKVYKSNHYPYLLKAVIYNDDIEIKLSGYDDINHFFKGIEKENSI